jgi:peptidoglycan/xylan/chitin deacetylase (PgdA/CDA1 family)
MHSIPILMFHALEDDDTPISFAPKLFERALKQWHSQGWRTLPLEEVVRRLKTRQELPANSFVITFDDGYASVYRHGVPVMQALGMTPTIFLAPNVTRQNNEWTPLPKLYDRSLMTWKEIRELQAHGFTFGAHTLTHPDLTRLADEDLDRELRVSQEILQDALGTEVKLFAYPFGSSDTHVREQTAKLYDAACSVRLGLAGPGSDLFALERVEMYYLRAQWAADGLTRGWFPLYLAARNVPRRVRKILMPGAEEIPKPAREK